MAFHSWDYPRIAHYVKLLDKVPPRSILNTYERAASQLAFIQKNLTDALAEMKDLTKDRSESKEGP
jgi:hypothetical protein